MMLPLSFVRNNIIVMLTKLIHTQAKQKLSLIFPPTKTSRRNHDLLCCFAGALERTFTPGVDY